MSEREPTGWWQAPAPPAAHENGDEDFVLPPLRDYEPIQPERRGWREILRKIWAPIAAAGAFLVKFGAILFKLKIFTVGASMIVSVGAYALLGGWWFGVGLVVVMKQMPENAWKEARVALAGPILGSLGAAAVYAAGVAYDSRFLKAMAFVGFLINLFNLLPIVPLDGGRAVAALHPALWGIGLAGLVALEIYRPNPILPIIVILGALELWRRWQTRHHPQFERYYKVKPWQRIAVFVTYVGLAALLVLGMHAAHVPRSF